MTETRVPLLIGKSATLDASGAATVELGPSSGAGPANWNVTGVVVQTSRPGAAPVPRAQVYRDEIAATNSIGLTYDGSFGQGACDETLSRGAKLICRWTGGLAGDVATFTVAGWRW